MIRAIDCACEGRWWGIAECAGKLYCAPSKADSILVIDPKTDTTHTIDVKGITLRNNNNNDNNSSSWSFSGIAACEGKLYCAPLNAESILVIDPSNHDNTIRTLDCGIRGDGKWWGVAECGGKLYCAPWHANHVLVIDPRRDNAVSHIDLLVGSFGGRSKWNGIAACNGNLYCAPYDANHVLVIEAGNVVRVIASGVPRGQKGKWCGIAEHGGKLYCAPHNAHSILVIDPSTETTLSVDCGVQRLSKWCGIAECFGNLYCAPANAGSVLVIDPSNNHATHTIHYGSPGGGGEWMDVAASAEGKLYCAPNYSEKVLVIDVTTPKTPRGGGGGGGGTHKKRRNTGSAAAAAAMHALRRAAEDVEAARASAAGRSSSGDDDDLQSLCEPVMARFRRRDTQKPSLAGVFEDLRSRADVERAKLDEIQNRVRDAVRSSNEKKNGGRLLLESLVEERNKARAAYARALVAVQNGFSSSEFGLERLEIENEVRLLEARSRSLEKIRGEFFSSPSAEEEEPEEKESSTPYVRAVRAFEAWEQKTEAANAIANSTDEAFARAWRELAEVAESRGKKTACDAWEAAHFEALEAARHELEVRSSSPHPLSLLPVDAILGAIVARIGAFENEIDSLRRARDRAREARENYEELGAAESKAALRDAPWREAKDKLRTTKKNLRRSQRDLEDAVDEEVDDEGTIRSLREKVRAARRDLNRAQRATEDELSKLVELAQDHFPELRVDLDEALATAFDLSPGLRSVVRQGRSPQDYEQIPWPEHSEPPVSRHVVAACLYDGRACVLKQFQLRDASERRALEREVEVLVTLAHPNIAKLESVFFVESTPLVGAGGGGGGGMQAFIQSPLYRGGTLRQWLARPENAITAAAALDNNNAVSSRWITPRFLNVEHRQVATTHVRALRQLLTALSYVHAKGVVHGDVKLDNALVAEEDDGKKWKVVLSDFDMSRAALDGGALVAMTTRAGGGTPGYVAPEVRAGARANAASDVFSYGICAAVALAADDTTAHRVLTEQEELVLEATSHRGGGDDDDDALAAVLRACLAAQNQRPTASALEASSPLFDASDRILAEQVSVAKIKEAAALKRCAVCRDDGVSGVECANSHFVCDECLAGHVKAATDAESLVAFESRAGRIQCVVGAECNECYTDAAVASRVPQHVFAAYFAAKQRLVEQRIMADLEAGFERRVEDEALRISALSDAERRARDTKTHVVERVLTLACPRCGAAFAEALDGKRGFDGCFALKCHRPGCGCGFCAYCLADCGADAHEHVRACKLGQGLFPPRARETFRRVQRDRRDRDLRAYLQTLSDEDAHAAVAGLERELLDLGLNPRSYYTSS